MDEQHQIAQQIIGAQQIRIAQLEAAVQQLGQRVRAAEGLDAPAPEEAPAPPPNRAQRRARGDRKPRLHAVATPAEEGA